MARNNDSPLLLPLKRKTDSLRAFLGAVTWIAVDHKRQFPAYDRSSYDRRSIGQINQSIIISCLDLNNCFFLNDAPIGLCRILSSEDENTRGRYLIENRPANALVSKEIKRRTFRIVGSRDSLSEKAKQIYSALGR